MNAGIFLFAGPVCEFRSIAFAFMFPIGSVLAPLKEVWPGKGEEMCSGIWFFVGPLPVNSFQTFLDSSRMHSYFLCKF